MAPIELEPIPVVYVAAADGLAGVSDAWVRLESSIPSLRGRSFYGTYLDGEYRACMAAQPSDDANHPSLARWTIPGGAYASARLSGWQKRPRAIREAFEALHDTHHVDATRPDIEFYRSERELIVYVPVAGHGAPPRPLPPAEG